MKTENEIKDRLNIYKKKMEDAISESRCPKITSADLDEYWTDISYYKKRIQILEWVLK